MTQAVKRSSLDYTYSRSQYTSQTCSRCGHVDKKNRESQAVFVCKKCSYTANADVNAARNILKRGLDTLAVTSETLWDADGTRVEQGRKTNEKRCMRILGTLLKTRTSPIARMGGIPRLQPRGGRQH